MDIILQNADNLMANIKAYLKAKLPRGELWGEFVYFVSITQLAELIKYLHLSLS